MSNSNTGSFEPQFLYDHCRRELRYGNVIHALLADRRPVADSAIRPPTFFQKVSCCGGGTLASDGLPDPTIQTPERILALQNILKYSDHDAKSRATAERVAMHNFAGCFECEHCGFDKNFLVTPAVKEYILDFAASGKNVEAVIEHMPHGLAEKLEEGANDDDNESWYSGVYRQNVEDTIQASELQLNSKERHAKHGKRLRRPEQKSSSKKARKKNLTTKKKKHTTEKAAWAVNKEAAKKGDSSSSEGSASSSEDDDAKQTAFLALREDEEENTVPQWKQMRLKRRAIRSRQRLNKKRAAGRSDNTSSDSSDDDTAYNSRSMDDDIAHQTSSGSSSSSSSSGSTSSSNSSYHRISDERLDYLQEVGYWLQDRPDTADAFPECRLCGNKTGVMRAAQRFFLGLAKTWADAVNMTDDEGRNARELRHSRYIKTEDEVRKVQNWILYGAYKPDGDPVFRGCANWKEEIWLLHQAFVDRAHFWCCVNVNCRYNRNKRGFDAECQNCGTPRPPKAWEYWLNWRRIEYRSLGDSSKRAAFRTIPMTPVIAKSPSGNDFSAVGTPMMNRSDTVFSDQVSKTSGMMSEESTNPSHVGYNCEEIMPGVLNLRYDPGRVNANDKRVFDKG